MRNSFDIRNNHKIIFFIVLIFSFILRLFTLGNYESWVDEKLSVREANGILNYNFQPETIFTKSAIEKHNTLYNVICSTVQGDGGNGILYIVCLHYWSNLFGNTDFAVRFFSLILGILLVILAYILSIEIFGDKNLALLIMVLISIHPQLIKISQLARAYVLALDLTLFSSIILLKLANKNVFNNKYLFLYALLVAGSLLSHYSTIYIIAAHFFILIILYKIDFKNCIRLFSFLIITTSIVLLWEFNYGFEGLKGIASRNQIYIQLSKNDPSNPLYMKTSLYSICAGWSQNLLSFCGNTLVNLGLRIHVILPLLIIPFILMIYGLKKAERNQRILIKIFFTLSFSSLIYATLLSLIAGHIISFQEIYSVFSTPYFVILIGISIFLILNSVPKKNQYILNALIFSQIVIMMFSTAIIYLGFDSRIKSANHYEVAAEKIKTIYLTENTDFIITYKEPLTAMEMNKYLDGTLANIKQVIDTSKSNSALYLFFPKSNRQLILIEQTQTFAKSEFKVDDKQHYIRKKEEELD